MEKKLSELSQIKYAIYGLHSIITAKKKQTIFSRTCFMTFLIGCKNKQKL